ncbi:MAG: hypothetical protein JSW66_06625 [Phycisphaerales bacterium]|nr:MAG: hypothetical protein JSW66_06625 [Phycisphaerales bacterium]
MDKNIDIISFDDPYFRLILLLRMAWAAGEQLYRFDGLALRGVLLHDEQGSTSCQRHGQLWATSLQ